MNKIVLIIVIQVQTSRALMKMMIMKSMILINQYLEEVVFFWVISFLFFHGFAFNWDSIKSRKPCFFASSKYYYQAIILYQDQFISFKNMRAIRHSKINYLTFVTSVAGCSRVVSFVDVSLIQEESK